MTTLQMVYISGASWLLVFLRGIQQQNVIHGKYKLAVITTFGLAIADVLVIYNAALYGIAAIIPIAIGGVCGITLSMYVHRNFLHKL
jgi:hypothetical protein